jgi:hypothetical protein
MGRLTTVLYLGLLVLAACSSVRLENATESQMGERRGGVVSYRFSREQAAARQIMADYCSPKGYQIVRLSRASAEEAGHSILHEEDTDDSSPVVRRTYVRFECVRD